MIQVLTKTPPTISFLLKENKDRFKFLRSQSKKLVAKNPMWTTNSILLCYSFLFSNPNRPAPVVLDKSFLVHRLVEYIFFYYSQKIVMTLVVISSLSSM